MLSGATFNDTNKTITVSGGSSSLSSLTDCTIDTPNLSTNPILYYDSTRSKRINTDSLQDSILFVKDNVDGTKKMQFQISGITANQTRILTVSDFNCSVVGTSNTQSAGTGYIIISPGSTTTAPTWDQYDHVTLANKGSNTHAQMDADISATTAHGISGLVVGTTDSQALTNKTLTDSTNNMMAKSLKYAATTIDVSSATSPTTGQVLTATRSKAANWSSLNFISLNSNSQVDNKYINIPLNIIENASVYKPLSNHVLRYGTPKTPTAIILTTTWLYKVDDFVTKSFSVLCNTTPYPTFCCSNNWQSSIWKWSWGGH